MASRGTTLWSAVLSLVTGLALWTCLPPPADAQRVSDVRNTRHNLGSGSGNTVRSTIAGTTEVCVFCHTPHGATLADQGNQALRAPLWNRRVPAGSTYTPYTSSTLDAQQITDGLDAQPGGSSKLCLSCHDGTLAIGNVNVLNGTANRSIPMQGTGTDGVMPDGSGRTTGFTRFLGTDLTNDHPISVSYTQALADRDGELRKPDAQQRWPINTGTVIGLRSPGNKPHMPLEPTGANGLGQVQCATCHDPHSRELDASKGNQKFLRLQRFQELRPNNTYQAATDIVCLSCHDKNGSFGIWSYSAHANPDVANETYVASAATLREFPANLPVWKAACLNCHDTHTVQGARRLTREGTDGARSSALAPRVGGSSALENTCYQCHTTSTKAVLNDVSQVPNIEDEFARAIRMPITDTEQERSPETHDISSNFNDTDTLVSLDCSTATNKCGADLIEPRAKLAQRHVECTDCHNPHRVIRNRRFDGDATTPDTKGTHRIDATNDYTPSNLASGVLRGSWGVEPGYASASFHENPTSFTVKRGDPGGPPVSTTISATHVTREYQICLKCHSNYAYGTSPPVLGHPGGTTSGTNNISTYTNQAREFNPHPDHVGGGIGDVKNLGTAAGAAAPWNSGNHRSWHPVMAATGRTIGTGGTTRGLRGILASKNPWLRPFGNTSPISAVGNQTMYCSDCHGANTNAGSLEPASGVMGPHGSQNNFLLKAPFSASDPSLCFKCHDREVYSPTGDSKKSGWYTGFCCRGGTDDGRDQLHWYHWNKILSHDSSRTLKCNWCHVAVPHGWKNKALLLNLNDVGTESGDAARNGGNWEFRSSASGHVYNQGPYYLNAKLKVLTFATSGNWSDSNCGSRNQSGRQFGTNTNDTQTGKNWMQDTCSSPP